MDRQMNGGDTIDVTPNKKDRDGQDEADVVGEQGEAEGEMTEMEKPAKEARAEEVVEQVKR